jgi:hypothetical protein
VIKMPADGIKRSGRATQGVIVMRLRDGETVSALAPVVDSGEENGDPVVGAGGENGEPAVEPAGQNGDSES